MLSVGSLLKAKPWNLSNEVLKHKQRKSTWLDYSENRLWKTKQICKIKCTKKIMKLRCYKILMSCNKISCGIICWTKLYNYLHLHYYSLIDSDNIFSKCYNFFWGLHLEYTSFLPYYINCFYTRFEIIILFLHCFHPVFILPPFGS